MPSTLRRNHTFTPALPLLWMAGLLLCFATGRAAPPPALGMDEHPGGYIPLDTPFRDAEGRSITFAQIMDGRPAILTLNYYGCPGLCTPQLNDLAQNLPKVNLTEGKDYRIITLSFNPDEGPAEAAKKKANLLASMPRPFDPGSWVFLTGKDADIRAVTDSVGFHYEKQAGPNGMEEYVHPAVLVALSPEGKITRYLDGIQQLPFDIQMALMEASEGKVRPTIAKGLLFCFAFDPKNKTYVFAAEKIGAVVLTLLLAGFFLYLLRAGRKRQPREDNHA